MTSLEVIGTTTGALPLNTDLVNLAKRRLTIQTATDGSARLRVLIDAEELNNGAKLNGQAVELPPHKDYPNIVAFLKEWNNIEADPMQVGRQ